MNRSREVRTTKDTHNLHDMNVVQQGTRFDSLHTYTRTRVYKGELGSLLSGTRIGETEYKVNPEIKEKKGLLDHLT